MYFIELRNGFTRTDHMRLWRIWQWLKWRTNFHLLIPLIPNYGSTRIREINTQKFKVLRKIPNTPRNSAGNLFHNRKTCKNLHALRTAAFFFFCFVKVYTWVRVPRNVKDYCRSSSMEGRLRRTDLIWKRNIEKTAWPSAHKINFILHWRSEFVRAFQIIIYIC